MLSRLHRDCLQSLLGDEFAIHELEAHRPRGLEAVRTVVGGRIDGVTRHAETQVLARIRDEKVERVWLNGSNLGRLARATKKSQPDIEVLTFCHNVEARFFLSALKHDLHLRAVGVLIANYRAERMAVRNSDRIIALSLRDSGELRCLYGREATEILPMAIAEPDPVATVQAPISESDYLLFVGGGFYGNVEGMLWFARHVAPRVEIKTLVVGRGFEHHRGQLERLDKVRVIGPVEDLSPYYRNARAVIAPIFDGSGMKTKVAEALMHGRKVIGTPEAFSGYEAALPTAGWLCRNADEFVAQVNALFDNRMQDDGECLRQIFNEDYSSSALKGKILKMIGD